MNLALLRAALAAYKPRPARRHFTELEASLVATYGTDQVQALARTMESQQFDDAF